jgi:hypothetical protein
LGSSFCRRAALKLATERIPGKSKHGKDPVPLQFLKDIHIDFEAIKHEGKFKQEYRKRLDSLPIDQETATLIVDEANYAFKLNMDIFKELEGNWILSMLRLTWNSLRSQFQRRSPAEAAPQA